MPPKLEGKIERVTRFVTGLKTFDLAFQNLKGDIGFPIGAMTELSGPTGCGKSTFTFGLAGLIAEHLTSNIALADLEGFDPDFLYTILDNAGFNGTIYLLQDKSDEKILDKLKDSLLDDCSVGIIDSIGAISPIAESGGELGEANMGRRAKLMAQLSRKLSKELRDDRGNSIFMINHVHPRLGGFGTVTPGGETKNYLSGIIIRVKRKQEFPDQSYVIEGKVSKNRYGYRDRKFYVTMLAGTGIHIGLSALVDCLLLGLAEAPRNNVKMDDVSHGKLNVFFQAAHAGNNDPFLPFIEKLADKSPKLVDEEVEVEEE